MRFFFIVGAQKSGTTWLQRLLSGLPGVCCRGEGHFADSLVIPFANVLRDYNRRMQLVQSRVYQNSGEGFGLVSQREFDHVCRRFIEDRLLMGTSNDLLAIGDKTPANAKFLPTLTRLFPEARVIHIVRDGRDVAVSNYCHIRRIMDANPTDSPVKPFAEMANQLLHKWSEYVQSAEDFRSSNSSCPWLQIHYEQLLSAPVDTLQVCGEFLLEQILTVDQVANAVRAASFESRSQGRARGQEDPSSFLRKGIQGDWRNYFTDSIMDTINPSTVNLLERLGYASSTTQIS